jgi:hypothetical protein
MWAFRKMSENLTLFTLPHAQGQGLICECREGSTKNHESPEGLRKPYPATGELR